MLTRKLVIIYLLFLCGYNLINLKMAFAQSQVQCGTIIEGEFTEVYEKIRYHINLAPGDMLTVSGESVGNFLYFGIRIYPPSDNDDFIDQVFPINDPVIETDPLSERGNYIIELTSGDPGADRGVGIYTLYIGCILRDGTVIQPGDIQEEIVANTGLSEISSSNNYLFPNSSEIVSSEIVPITLGNSISDAIGSRGNDIFTYSYSANGNSSANLTVTKTGGNLSVGIIVVNQSTNNIIFIGGMPSSDTLSTKLNFEETGTYIIGIFRFDVLPNQTNSSGTFEMRLE